MSDDDRRSKRSRNDIMSNRKNKRKKRKIEKNNNGSSEGNRALLTLISIGSHIGRKIDVFIKNMKQSESQRSMSAH